MSRSFDENLALYAKLAVRLGVNVQPGQELIINAELGDAPLVRLLVEEGYRAGAKNVQVLLSDDVNTLTRFREASDDAIQYAPQWLYDGITQAMSDGAARLVVTSADPALLKSVDPAKVALSGKVQAMAARQVSEYIGQFLINWNIVGAASPAWARQVFPNDEPATALAKLWDAIFLTSRIFEEDPLAAWTSHCETLESRQNHLNSLNLDAVHFRGPGTDLRVGLAEGNVWIGGWGYAKNGVRCSPNIPTEEIFTMPHRLRVDGTVRSTKPLSLRGQVVDGIEIEFKGGAVTSAKAVAGEATLLGLLESDPGAKHLGEVALVPNSSKVSQSGVLFLNTLYDENAACHIALGRSLSENMRGSDELSEDERIERGANDSIIHVDWMIGSGEVDVDGVRADGSVVPLLVQGEWV